jgi:alpha-1,2-mannosyltransferase
VKRAIQLVVLLAAIVLVVHGGTVVAGHVNRAAPGAAVDFPPLYAGASALASRRDPVDPVVLAQVMDERATGFHREQLFSYYPPSASALLLPLAWVPWGVAVSILRWVLAASIAGTAVFGALAGPARAGSRWERIVAPMTAAAVALAVILHVRLASVVIRTGQVSPLLTLACALGFYGLARGRAARAGAILGLGVALKLVPVVFLPVLVAGRRWRALAFFAVVPLLLLGVALVLHPAMPTLGAATMLMDRGWFAEWGFPGRWVVVLWGWRFLAPAVPVLGSLVVLAFRPASAERVVAACAITLAWAGTVLAGTHYYHEAFVLLPVAAWVVAGPWTAVRRWVGWSTAACLVALMAWMGVFRLQAPRASLEWVPVGYFLCAAATLRFLATFGRRER